MVERIFLPLLGESREKVLDQINGQYDRAALNY